MTRMLGNSYSHTTISNCRMQEMLFEGSTFQILPGGTPHPLAFCHPPPRMFRPFHLCQSHLYHCSHYTHSQLHPVSLAVLTICIHICTHFHTLPLHLIPHSTLAIAKRATPISKLRLHDIVYILYFYLIILLQTYFNNYIVITAC